jgi:hypothetical protein
MWLPKNPQPPTTTTFPSDAGPEELAIVSVDVAVIRLRCSNELQCFGEPGSVPAALTQVGGDAPHNFPGSWSRLELIRTFNIGALHVHNRNSEGSRQT